MINSIDKLKNIIKYAYDEVAYYKNIFDDYQIDINKISDIEDIRYLPILKKEIVQNQATNMISREYQKFPKNQFIEIRHTSGSSGEILKIYRDRRYNIKSLMSLWRVRNYWYSINPSMKYCSFHTTIYVGNKLIKPENNIYLNNGYNLSFNKLNLNEQRINEIYDNILLFNPDWLNIEPSIGILLAEIIDKYKMKIPSNLKYIELSGEMLTNSNRYYIEEMFKVKIVNQYGTSETNGIAIECECGNMHILEDNVVVEVLKDGQPVTNQEGDIHVTPLYSYTMPFIRYNTNDKGIIYNEKCPCGRHSKLLKLTSGRNCDFITLKNDQKLSSFTLYGIIEIINDHVSHSIKQYQIIEKSQENYDVIFSLKESYKGWESSIISTFYNYIKSTEFNNSIWNISFVDRIFPDNKTGKIKYFKSLLNN